MSASHLRRNLLLAAGASFLVGASSVHCSAGGTSSGTTGFGASANGGGSATGGGSHTGATGTGGDVTIDVQTKDYSAEDFFESDPPPLTCDGGGQPPPPPSGTPECPSDKNLEGCPCPTAGATAACWSGKRKNRNHGICHDGMTTCQLTGESTLSWGPCAGEQLPTGTTGKEACGCFSGGHWDIANLSPCFFTTSSGGTSTTVAVSTTISGGQIQCPASADTAPADPWSTDTLITDCTGNFQLCYTIKAGDGKNPLPTDCTIIKSCTQAYYSTANVKQDFPPLAGWLSDPSASACVQQFINGGGYGEMSVNGQSDECELVDKEFQRVTYCPLACNDPNPPAMCAQCTPGGGGSF